MSKNESGSEKSEPKGVFATTHWSVVLAAGDSQSPNASTALELLCRTYWYPIYAFARREGNEEEKARDLTQGFFAHLLSRQDLSRPQKELGRFRTFLLSSFKHFATSEWRKARAEIRGGRYQFVSLEDAEERYLAEPGDGVAPDRVFDRKWALSVMDKALNRLEAEYAESGQQRLFGQLSKLLSGDAATAPYEVLAAQIKRPLATFKNDVFRVRQRYREQIRAVIAETVAQPAEVDEELRYLIEVLSG